MIRYLVLLLLPYVCLVSAECGNRNKYGEGPPVDCALPVDPNNKPRSTTEDWFTKEMFLDLFPRANIGHGPQPCWPYSYEAFVIAARYFPLFGAESPSNNGYSARENHRRDLSAFFAHAVQETGENDAYYYSTMGKEEADDCYYRGGFYNWFEGGSRSGFLLKHDFRPSDGDRCAQPNLYCNSDPQNDYFWKCNTAKAEGGYAGCYIGRGAIQISWNYNYGQYQRWLAENGIQVDLLRNPNLIMTKMDPPISIMASLWFYMTPQPPKPAMHDIVMGNWYPGPQNKAAGYEGAIFGPTSLVINNECGGEDSTEPGGPGESRRIKAFKWFTKYFKVPVESAQLLSCKGMPQRLDEISHDLTYGPDWSTTWRNVSCQCSPAAYGGIIPFYQADHYPQSFVEQNPRNKAWCENVVKDNPQLLGLSAEAQCLKFNSAASTVAPSTKATMARTTAPAIVRTTTARTIATAPSSTAALVATTDAATSNQIELPDCQWNNQKVGKDCQRHYILCHITQWYPELKYTTTKEICLEGKIFYIGDCYGSWAIEACES